MATRKRTKLVIEPKIQYSLVRQLAVQWSLHLLGTVVLLTTLQVLLGGILNGFDYHWARIWPTVASFIVSLFFLLPIFVLGSLKLSNRFAGPIHRLRRELRDISAGKPYKKISFRDGDYWQELSNEFEEAVQAVYAQVREDGEKEYAVKPNRNDSNNEASNV